MSVTPGLGAFNKDKVANKFGIQLKKKETNEKCAQSPLSPSMEMDSTTITETSTVTKNNTVSDFRSQNQSNGLEWETLSSDRPCLSSPLPSPSPSTSNESTSKPMGQSSKSKSTGGLMMMMTSTMANEHQRPASSTSTSNHSNASCPVNSNELIQSTSASSVSTDRPASSIDDSSSTSPARSLLQEGSSAEDKPSLLLSPPPSPSLAKTEAEIEHQKDQPLYKRQLSKTLDNSTSTMMNKHKHPHDHPIASTTDSTR